MASSGASSDATESSSNAWPFFGTPQNKPIVCIVVGMAGTGKTTFMQRVSAYVGEKKIPSYFINLDPAVSKIPYKPNIDIRDSLNYKQVMKQYNLGPNGGIMTSLNLFSTRFDQLMTIIEKRTPNLKYIFVDTPGQIEVFNWSASGTIITDSLASTFPTSFVYVVDTPRCVSPTTFMSNMLYACSILYKSRLPLILAFNKVDVTPHNFAVEWMQDSQAFDDAVRAGGNYMANLTQSMGLMLQEFYQHLTTVGISARTGIGFDDFFAATLTAVQEYQTEYLPELLRRITLKQEKEDLRQKEQLAKVANDMKLTGGVKVVTPPTPQTPTASSGINLAPNDDDEDEEDIDTQ
jgi:hypothetical protein